MKQLSIDRDNRAGDGAEALWPCVERAFAAAFANRCPGLPVQIGVVLVGGEEMAAINRDARGVDAVTDVLSFPLVRLRAPADEARLARAPRDPESGGVALGDVALCLTRAAQQAEEYGHSFERELSYLCVHAALHLLGFDHLCDKDRRLMRGEEERILSHIGQTRGEAEE